MPLSVVDVVLGSLVLGLAGWALVHTCSPAPARRGGCGGGCSPAGCGSHEPEAEDEPLVTIGGSANEPMRER